MTALKAPARAPKIQLSHFSANVRDLEPFDLAKSDDEIMAETEALCRRSAGFQPYVAWRENLSKQLHRPVVAKPFG